MARSTASDTRSPGEQHAAGDIDSTEFHRLIDEQAAAATTAEARAAATLDPVTTADVAPS